MNINVISVTRDDERQDNLSIACCRSCPFTRLYLMDFWLIFSVCLCAFHRAAARDLIMSETTPE